MPPTSETELNSGVAAPAGTDDMEYTSCTLCGVDDCDVYREVQSERFPEETFRLVRCRRCGQIYLNPRPTAEGIGRYYEPSPSQSEAFADYPAYEFLDRMMTGRSSMMERIKNVTYAGMTRLRSGPIHPVVSALLSPVSFLLSQKVGGFPRWRVDGQRLLDIGCGDGYFLYFMRQAGWDVAGVEIDPDAAARGRAYGLRIHTGTLDESTFPEADGTFDVVRFWHSLEHVHRPDIALRAAHRLLRPGGEILVAVPNAGGAAARMCGPDWPGYDVPLHLHHYTRETLRQLLWQAGFRPIAIRTYSIGHLEWIYNSLASRLRSVAKSRNATPAVDARNNPSRLGGAVAQLVRVAAIFPVETFLNEIGRGDSLAASAWKPSEIQTRAGEA